MSSGDESAWPYDLSGASGPLIGFLHGFLGQKADWSGVIAGLSGQFRCAAYDLPGHGANAAAFGINDMSTAVKELDVQRHVAFRESWHLVGYSLGGRFALHFALMFPKSVLSLTLISSSPGIEDELQREKRRKDDASWAAKAQMLAPDSFLEQWYRQPVFADLANKPALKEKLIRDRIQYRPRHMAQILQNWGQGNVPSLWQRLSEIQCPVQVVVGKDDEAYVRHLQRMRDLSPSIHGVMVEHAGHAVHLEQPGDVAAAIRQFTGKS